MPEVDWQQKYNQVLAEATDQLEIDIGLIDWLLTHDAILRAGFHPYRGPGVWLSYALQQKQKAAKEAGDHRPVSVDDVWREASARGFIPEVMPVEFPPREEEEDDARE